MKLTLKRNWLLGDTTIGTLYINDEFECYTLEDEVRNEKIYGETAISYGTYNIIINYSPKFKRKLPLLLNVPKFVGIRIHPGTSIKDTEGCILVGEYIKGKKIYNSRNTFNRLYSKLERAYNRGEKITIDVVAPDIKRGKGILGLIGLGILGIIGYKQIKKYKKLKQLKAKEK